MTNPAPPEANVIEIVRWLALLVAAAVPCEIGAGAQAAHGFVGVHTNVAVSTVIDDGWSLCFSDVYANAGARVSEIQNACSGKELLLACRPIGDPFLTVAAHAPRADVLFDTGMSETPHYANGVAWYYSYGWSWGFAAQDDAITRSPCDTHPTNPHSRLCWHTNVGSLIGGWRCGAAVDLSEDATYERLIFHRNGKRSAATPISNHRRSLQPRSRPARRSRPRIQFHRRRPTTRPSQFAKRNWQRSDS